MRAEGLKLTQHYRVRVCVRPHVRPCSRDFTRPRAYSQQWLAFEAAGQRQPALLPEDVTIAEVLKQAGYATGGDWQVGLWR